RWDDEFDGTAAGIAAIGCILRAIELCGEMRGVVGKEQLPSRGGAIVIVQRPGDTVGVPTCRNGHRGTGKAEGAARLGSRRSAKELGLVAVEGERFEGVAEPSKVNKAVPKPS